ncbi:MAG TPA: hypothetical protein VD947_04135 [Patescibacteria group bacterium]|nr:hypothetical protein [Patescibacteria group bacterium]
MNNLLAELRQLKPQALIESLEVFLRRTNWDSHSKEEQAASRAELDEMRTTLDRDYPAIARVIPDIANRFEQSGASDHEVSLVRTGATMLAFALKEQGELPILDIQPRDS